MTPHLQTGELLIITTVLLLWAGQPGCVCAFMCTCGCVDVSARPCVGGIWSTPGRRCDNVLLQTKALFALLGRV